MLGTHSCTALPISPMAWLSNVQMVVTENVSFMAEEITKLMKL
jgi:hypothetical protein